MAFPLDPIRLIVPAESLRAATVLTSEAAVRDGVLDGSELPPGLSADVLDLAGVPRAGVLSAAAAQALVIGADKWSPRGGFAMSPERVDDPSYERMAEAGRYFQRQADRLYERDDKSGAFSAMAISVSLRRDGLDLLDEDEYSRVTKRLRGMLLEHAPASSRAAMKESMVALAAAGSSDLVDIVMTEASVRYSGVPPQIARAASRFCELASLYIEARRDGRLRENAGADDLFVLRPP